MPSPTLVYREIGPRPDAVNQLNGGSFQQDAITTRHGWQYAAVYLDHRPGVRRIRLARRKLSEGDWDFFDFEDYDQVLDDGHNVIALGISPADGRIHLAWDLHSSTFNYRLSSIDLTSSPETVLWSADSFEPIRHDLPGLGDSGKFLSRTTYPRFISMPSHIGTAMLLELRTGMSGLGSDWLFAYNPKGDKPQWTELGIYLEGVENNPYINGLDIDLKGVLRVTYCYRGYVECDPTAAAQQAGPNGPENNYDLHYVYSPTGPEGYPGVEWYNSKHALVGRAPGGVPPSADGTQIFAIPMCSGILNQEAQCVAPDAVHVLNREDVDGVSTWMHYTIPNTGSPSRSPLSIRPASSTSARGKLVYRNGRLLALLHLSEDLVIVELPTEREIARVTGAGGLRCQEVLYDRYREDALSIFVGIDNRLVVVDLDI